MRSVPFAAVRELALPQRLFLLFTAINVFSWQCVAGQALVLFARAAGMPPGLVGLLLSFMPISMLLVVFAVPLVEWLGPRQLLLSTWLARNLLAASVFFMPWAIGRYGSAAGWQILLFATLAFSLIRAVGVGGWYPWLHELVPRPQLSTYFAVETAMSQLIAILVSLFLARILAMGEGLGRFFWVYGAGITTGLISVLFIRRIPGGAGLAAGSRIRYDPRPALRQVRADLGYRKYVQLAVLGLGSLMFLNSAQVMYLRDVLGYGDTAIMLLLALGAVGVALTIRFWGRTADRTGSVPAMIPLLTGHSLFAFGWLGLLPGWSPHVWLVAPVLLFTAVFNAAFAMVTARGMFCRVREEGRLGYMAMWIWSVSLANGVPPILAGWLIGLFGLTGFRTCFLISGLTGLTAAALMSGLPPEEGQPPEPDLHHLVRPSQPLRSLGRIFWITLGLGEKEEKKESGGQREEPAFR